MQAIFVKFCKSISINFLFHSWVCGINIFYNIKVIKITILPSIHTQRLRHGCVDQPGPRYVLIVTINLQQSALKPDTLTPKTSNKEKQGPCTQMLWCHLWGFRLIYKQQNKRLRGRTEKVGDVPDFLCPTS